MVLRFLLISVLAFADSSLRKLAEEPQWLRLLHYQKVSSGYESEVGGQDFFLSPQGKTDPEAELKAAIDILKTPGEKRDLALCRFPARYKWLKEKIPSLSFQWPGLSCKYSEYKAQLAAQSVSIVFSGYYLNNPASAFGHTLLRFNKALSSISGKQLELLDTGVNFSAVVTVDNAVLYAFYGLFGLFEGTFSRMPYYYKVREYNDFESRDLWSFDLNLTPSQIERLGDHLWELGWGKFDYYYLSKNCSYQILAAIDAALPEAGLSDSLPPYVIPVDTVKALAKVPGLIKDVHYRPSIRGIFEERARKLSSEEKEALVNLTKGQDPESIASELSANSRAKILDSAMDYIDLKYFRELVFEPEGTAAKWKRNILIARSKVPLSTPPMEIAALSDGLPTLSHSSRRIGFSGGMLSGGPGILGLEFRFALHDLIDPGRGFPKGSEIEFLNTKLDLRISRDPAYGKLNLEDFHLFKITSLTPLSLFHKTLSWKVRLGAQPVKDARCDNCIVGKFEIGGGVTLALGEGGLLYSMLDTTIDLSGKQSPSFITFGLGPSLGLWISMSEEIKFLATAQYRFLFLSDEKKTYRAGFDLRWAFQKDYSLSFGGALHPREKEARLTLYHYF